MVVTDLSSKTIKLIRTSMAQSFKVPYKELPRVLFHGLILSSIIAGFWLLDSLKDPIVANTIGIEYQPIAKLISVISTLFIVCIYDFLTSVVSKPILFHIVSGFFGLIFMIIAALLTDPKYGLGNTDIGPKRMLGWVAFCSIEAYGSLMVALFWSFTNSIMDLEQAKGAYGLIIATAQLGAIIGSTLATNAHYIGMSQLFIISSVMIFSISLLIKCYHLTFRDYATEANKARVRSISENSNIDPLLNSVGQKLQHIHTLNNTTNNTTTNTTTTSHHLNNTHKTLELDHLEDNNTNTTDDDIMDIEDFNPIITISSNNTCVQSIRNTLSGFSEGLLLLFSYSYMIKLLGVSVLYEIIMTILDYQFKVLGSHSKIVNLHHLDNGDGFAQLLGHFGQFTNILSFILSFFGFSYIVYNLGIRYTLLIFPSILFITVIITNLIPNLWVLFTMVSLMKALIFSLQDPVHELLYIPTSDAIKFKVKAWIDVFGSRLSKAIGSSICTLAYGNPILLRKYSEIPCLCIAILILYITYSIGIEFELLISNKTIIGNITTTSNSNSSKDIEKIANKLYSIDQLTEYDPFLSHNNSNTNSSSNTTTNRVRNVESGELELTEIYKNNKTIKNNEKYTYHSYPDRNNPDNIRNGLRPGDVGYDGYDLHLFNGVYSSDDDNNKNNNKRKK